MTNNFIIRFDDTLTGADFDCSLEELFSDTDIPMTDEYIVNWYESALDIEIESIEADDEIVWCEKSIDLDNWTDTDDRIIEGLTGYIENNII